MALVPPHQLVIFEPVAFLTKQAYKLGMFSDRSAGSHKEISVNTTLGIFNHLHVVHVIVRILHGVGNSV